MSHQSLVLTNFNHFEVRERTLAELTGENAIVKILATAICGSDIHGSSGSTGRRFPDQVMGHETCGVVEKVSAQSSAGLIGKRVVINPVISCHACELCSAGKEYVCRSRKVLLVKRFRQLLRLQLNLWRLDTMLQFGQISCRTRKF